MSKHQLAELRGRKKTQQRFGAKVQFAFTTGKYDGVDFYSTGTTLSVGEIKNYDDPLHPRNLRDHEDYMIDHAKLSGICMIAKMNGLRPLLVVYFKDYTVIWDLSDIDIDGRANWRLVNKDGQNYGEEKEWSYMTYLYESEAIWMENAEITNQKIKGRLLRS